jgi:hypothetical protein
LQSLFTFGAEQKTQSLGLMTKINYTQGLLDVLVPRRFPYLGYYVAYTKVKHPPLAGQNKS